MPNKLNLMFLLLCNQADMCTVLDGPILSLPNVVLTAVPGPDVVDMLILCRANINRM